MTRGACNTVQRAVDAIATAAGHQEVRVHTTMDHAVSLAAVVVGQLHPLLPLQLHPLQERQLIVLIQLQISQQTTGPCNGRITAGRFMVVLERAPVLHTIFREAS